MINMIVRKIKITILSLVFSFSQWSCEKTIFDKTDGYKIYTIKKGHQYSDSGFRAFTSTELNFVVVFDNSAIYTTTDSSNQLAINKLFGFSDCSDLHHENSARFGWRWYNNEIQIFAYCYKNSKRADKFIGTVNLNKEYEYKLKTEGSKYIFFLNGMTDSLDNGCSSDVDYGRYFLYPYFGGIETAPHQITIRIKELRN